MSSQELWGGIFSTKQLLGGSGFGVRAKISRKNSFSEEMDTSAAFIGQLWIFGNNSKCLNKQEWCRKHFSHPISSFNWSLLTKKLRWFAFRLTGHRSLEWIALTCPAARTASLEPRSDECRTSRSWKGGRGVRKYLRRKPSNNSRSSKTIPDVAFPKCSPKIPPQIV